MIPHRIFNFLTCVYTLMAFKYTLAYRNDTHVAKAFCCSKLVPDVTPCAPQYELQVEYPFGNVVYPGKKLSPAEVVTPPRVTFLANSSKYYTLVMVDPDIPILHNLLDSEFRHWMVGNIPGDDVTAGETLAFYFSPTPLPLTGAHRYTFLVYEQNGYIRFNKIQIMLSRFMPINDFVKTHGLGCPVFGNFFISAAKYLLGLI